MFVIIDKGIVHPHVKAFNNLYHSRSIATWLNEQQWQYPNWHWDYNWKKDAEWYNKSIYNSDLREWVVEDFLIYHTSPWLNVQHILSSNHIWSWGSTS